MRERPIVALLTDFGQRDHYVGAMKGALLSVCPQASLVDLSHEAPAHDITAGAFLLDAAHDAFPAETVFLAVVDPGVGSGRRALALHAGGFLFVGPDNGLFTLIYDRYGSERAHEITNTLLTRPRPSPVFHGRDVFAPVAGHLAAGLPIENVGPLVPDPVRLSLPPKLCNALACEGTVVLADRFGNLITNLLREDLRVLAAERLEIRAADLRLPLVTTYADVPVGTPCALVGSSGRLEIAVRQGRADALPGLAPGERVRVYAAS